MKTVGLPDGKFDCIFNFVELISPFPLSTTAPSCAKQSMLSCRISMIRRRFRENECTKSIFFLLVNRIILYFLFTSIIVSSFV